MCYCDLLTDGEILRDIQARVVPRAALTRDCCWGRICKVREDHHRAIAPGTWMALWDEACRNRPRGWLFAR
jgi:hypothetical protein